MTRPTFLGGGAPPSEYDRSCGMYGLSPFQLRNPECLKTFICSQQSKFANCLNTMNCYMMVGMMTYASNGSEGDYALFFYHMIQHHVNAVNMAKALFIANVLDCPDLWQLKSLRISSIYVSPATPKRPKRFV
jgi:hypothetical protein